MILGFLYFTWRVYGSYFTFFLDSHTFLLIMYFFIKATIPNIQNLLVLSILFVWTVLIWQKVNNLTGNTQNFNQILLKINLLTKPSCLSIFSFLICYEKVWILLICLILILLYQHPIPHLLGWFDSNLLMFFIAILAKNFHLILWFHQFFPMRILLYY